MKTKLENHLEVWADSGLLVRVLLVTGDVIEGRLKEFDRSELVIEPVYDGEAGPITVIQVAHVVTATYSDFEATLEDLPGEAEQAGL